MVQVLMPYEAARITLGGQLERLQTATKAADTEIARLADETNTYTQKRAHLEKEMRDVAAALNALGGPVPDWTDDLTLIAFWDELQHE